MRFSKIVNATVRFRVFMYPTAWFGAVFRYSQILPCGSVRFSDIANLTVRFGAVPR